MSYDISIVPYFKRNHIEMVGGRRDYGYLTCVHTCIPLLLVNVVLRPMRANVAFLPRVPPVKASNQVRALAGSC